MSRLFHESSPSPNPRQVAASRAETDARWLSEHDDGTLGFESANPALQIDRWGQEALPMSGAPE